jgi:hypothetical protein
MSKQLQLRADDLAECLLVAELEMRRSWNVDAQIAAYRDFGRIVDSIDVLRRDVEELHVKDDLLRPLDRKVASIMRSQPYRIAEWFLLYSDVRWFVGQATVDPVQHVTQC